MASLSAEAGPFDPSRNRMAKMRNQPVGPERDHHEHEQPGAQPGRTGGQVVGEGVGDHEAQHGGEERQPGGAGDDAEDHVVGDALVGVEVPAAQRGAARGRAGRERVHGDEAQRDHEEDQQVQRARRGDERAGAPLPALRGYFGRRQRRRRIGPSRCQRLRSIGPGRRHGGRHVRAQHLSTAPLAALGATQRRHQSATTVVARRRPADRDGFTGGERC